MPRSPLAGVLSLIVGLTAASAAPITALAHGFAHHHETTEHHDADHGSFVAVRDQSVTDHDLPALETEDHNAGDHQHANLGVALTAKVTPLVALVAPRVILPIAREVVLPPREADAPLAPRANPGHAPPPRLRAPPTFVG